MGSSHDGLNPHCRLEWGHLGDSGAAVGDLGELGVTMSGLPSCISLRRLDTTSWVDDSASQCRKSSFSFTLDVAKRSRST